MSRDMFHVPLNYPYPLEKCGFLFFPCHLGEKKGSRNFRDNTTPPPPSCHPFMPYFQRSWKTTRLIPSFQALRAWHPPQTSPEGCHAASNFEFRVVTSKLRRCIGSRKSMTTLPGGFLGSGWCSTLTLLLICSSFSRENGHLLLICSSISTAQ